MGTNQFFEGHDITKLRQWLHHYLDKHSDSDPKTFTDYILELIPTIVTPSNRLDTVKLVNELSDVLESKAAEKFVGALSNVLQSKSYMHESRSGDRDRDRNEAGASDGGRHHSDSRESYRDEYHHHHPPHTRRRQRDDRNDRTSHHSRSHYDGGGYNDRDQKRRRRESPTHYSSGQYRETQYDPEHRNYYNNGDGSWRRHVDGYEPAPHPHPPPPHVSPYSMAPYQSDRDSYFHPSQRGVAQDAVTLVSAGGRVHSFDEDQHSRERFDHGGRRGRHHHGEYSRGGRGGRRGGRGGRRDTGPAPPEAYLPKRTQEEWAKLEEEIKDNKCTIVVSSIPPEHSNHDELRNYFTQFGQISEMSVKKHLNRAYIQFENFDDAMKAVKSPEAIFGNRFIRVNFAKKQDFNVGGSAKKKRHIDGEDSSAVDSTGNQEIAPGTTQGSNAYISPQTLEKIQKEQKLHRIQQEQLQLQQDIQQLQQQKQLEKEKLLLQSTLDLRKTLTAKLDEADESESNKQKIIDNLKDLDETIAGILERIKKNETVTASAPAPVPVSRHVTHHVTAVTASTQSDLKESSDTPSETTEKSSESEEMVGAMESSSHFRGRGRGYRGGSWRGRGAGAPGRGRGNFRGGYSAGGGLSLKLSNSTSFVVTNIPESKRSAEAIKGHFSAFGELVSVDTNEGEDRAVIQFDTRQSAEQAIKQGKQLEGNTLRFTWHQPQSPIDEAPSHQHVSTTHTGVTEEPVEEVSPGGKPSTRDRFRREKDDDDEDDIYTYDDDDEDRERSWKR